MINSTFIQPIDFAIVVEPGNTIIEGHRGSGKSMMLKYLSYEEQMNRNFCEEWDKRYVGIYLKFKNTVVDTVTLELFNGTRQEWTNYFLSYVNLLIGERIIKCLKIAKDEKIVSIDSEKDLVSEIEFLFFYFILNKFEKEDLKNLLLLISRIRNEFTQKHFLEWTLPGDFLEQLISTIKDHVKEWSEKDFYILLDEYDNLSGEQQKIVNTLVKNRSFSYKIGVKLFDMIYEDVHGRLLEKNNDFTYVSTDRFDLRPERYKEFVINVANKRLSTYGYKNTIVDLLPSEDDKNRRGFENGDYSGIENIIKLSSGIIRDFLELCKDMVYYSNTWVLKERNESSKDKLDIITPNIQNTVIKIHSNILYENVDRIGGIDDDSGKARSEIARILIDNLAEIFNNILIGSESNEDRTVSSFQLKEVEKLDKTSTNALNDSVSYRLLQVPYSPRRPQEITKYAPHKRYRFHRLLCPRFRLSLADRWPKEINAEFFNEIFSNPKNFVSQITKYFIKNTPPTIDRKITDYE
ncbi:MAG: hypothetical protein QM426_11315 [Euryarchaeota archaeon]|nr:hypothetical protein [Euryarchaeota archaeon]